MSKVKKQTAKKLPRQIKCVKMMSEPLTDEQNAIMQVAMKTRLPVQNETVSYTHLTLPTILLV